MTFALVVTTIIAPVQGRVCAQVPAKAVLMQVENRKILTSEEAEKKMKEIVRDLFSSEN